MDGAVSASNPVVEVAQLCDAQKRARLELGEPRSGRSPESLYGGGTLS